MLGISRLVASIRDADYSMVSRVGSGRKIQITALLRGGLRSQTRPAISAHPRWFASPLLVKFKSLEDGKKHCSFIDGISYLE
jgi:hypothetical protein